MELGFDYEASLRAALADALATASAAGRLARRAEDAFEGALASGCGEEAAAERYRAAHRAHVDAMTELAEVEAALGEHGVPCDRLGRLRAETLAA